MIREIPFSWYHHLRYTTKRGTYTDHLAVILLAEIVFDCSLSESGIVRKSYKEYCASIGASYQQTRAAVSFLVDAGLVSRVFTCETDEVGRIESNVMFLEAMTERIAEISHSVKNEDLAAIAQAVPKSKRRSSKMRYAAIFDRDDHACVYCGSTANLTIDHKVPTSRGGGNSASNLCTCCGSCNSAKGARTPDEWYSAKLAAKSA